MLIAVGTETAATGGHGTGVQTWWWTGDVATSRLIDTAAVDSPTFLARHPRLPLIYATSELDKGLVTTLAVTADGNLQVVDQQSTGGATPCHLTVSPDGRHLLIAHYGDGTLATLALNEAGRPSELAEPVRHRGSGPDAERQEGPHLHQVIAAGDEFLTCDLGNDTITAYRLVDGVPVVASRTSTPAGSGPRHLVQTADGETAYVTAELDNGILWYERDALTPWALRYRVPAAGPVNVEVDVPNLPSHLAFSDDEQYLFVGNRGKDRLTVFDVGGGEPIYVCDGLTGAWPRHFAQIGSDILIAAQHDNLIKVLGFDTKAETLTHRGALPVASPMCILPLPATS